MSRIRNSLAAAQNFLETYNRSQHVKEHLKIQMCLWSQEASWWGISATDGIMSLSWGTEYSGLLLFPSWVGWNIYYKPERSGVKCFTGKLEVADEWQTSVDPRLTSMTHITSVLSPPLACTCDPPTNLFTPVHAYYNLSSSYSQRNCMQLPWTHLSSALVPSLTPQVT